MQFLRRSLTGLFLVSLTFGLLFAAGASFWSAVDEVRNREERRRPSRERVVAITTVEIQPGRVVPQLTAFGEVLSRRSLELRAGAGGRIVYLDEGFEDGALVKAGSLLAQVDPTDADGALDVAGTDLAEAEAELREAERNLILATDELTAAQAQADLRRQALARQQELSDRGVGTAAAVETAALAEASANQSVLTRRMALASAESRIDQAKNRVSRAKISLDTARRDLLDTEIRAAFDGALADVSIVSGGIVTTNERVATLVDPTDLEVAFRVSTAQFARLIDPAGQPIPAPVQVALDIHGDDIVATGRISRVGATVGEGQTGRRLFARLEQSAGFRPGDFVTVRVEEPALTNVARVPATALGPDISLLAINGENRLDKVPVTLVRRQGDDVLVRAPGLEGRRVVAERTPLLGPGILVRDISGSSQPQVAGGAPAPTEITLTPERRAKLIAAVQSNNRMPDDVKERMLSQLQQDKVPAQTVERIEARMGG